jgi:peptidoglycan/LPS O-acetylase OafA/YrhL
MEKNDGYIRSLDGIRALALLLIMTYHAELFHFSWVSVQLFFVLSGFLITGILWKEKTKPYSLGFKFKKFWVRRSLRIFPLYVGYLLVIGIAYLLFNFPSYFPTYFPYLATYTVNYSRLIPEWQGNPLFTHLWTLSIEEQFYFLFPLIIFLCPQKFIKRLMVFIILISPVLRYLVGEYYKSKGLAVEVIADAVYWNTLSHLDAFCFGGIIPVLMLDKKIKNPMWILRFILILFFVAGGVNYIFSGSELSYWDDYGYNHWLISNYQHVWHYTLINILCAAVILVLTSPFSVNSIRWFRKFLEHPWIVRIGKVSYGMYVFHWIVLVYVFNNIFKPETYWMKVLLFVPYVAVTYAVSELSYSFFEVYFIKLKDKFFVQKPREAAPVPQPAVTTNNANVV